MNQRLLLWLAIPVIGFLILQYKYFGNRFIKPHQVVYNDTSVIDFEKRGTSLVVGFYNLENLFDTIDDKHNGGDNEFLPAAKSEWTSQRYQTKINHMAKVIAAMHNNQSPDILGVCELENVNVLNDLVNDPQIKDRNYQIVHYDSPDQRGIDVALLYKKDRFNVIASKPINVSLDDDPEFKTRDILWVTGVVKGNDTLNVFVNHWPSRRGGEKESAHKREAAAKTLRTYADILRQNSKARIVIVGDFNDEPTDSSISTTLGAIDVLKNNCNACLYNPMFTLQKQNLGSYFYQSGWDMIDQIIFTQNVADKSYYKSDLSNVVIFQQDWMMFTDEKTGKARPNRTYAGIKYIGGYSDHLPVYAKIVVR